MAKTREKVIDGHTAPEHPKRGHGGGGELQVPGCTHRQQTEREDQHRGCRQKGDEQTLLPEVAEGLDIFSPGALFFAVVYWGGSIVASKPDTMEAVVEIRMRNLSILDNSDHLLHPLLDRQQSSVSNTPIQHHSHKDRCRKSFLPSAITQ